jgi:RimJ/RimL family protein N-acetyltransferase
VCDSKQLVLHEIADQINYLWNVEKWWMKNPALAKANATDLFHLVVHLRVPLRVQLRRYTDGKQDQFIAGFGIDMFPNNDNIVVFTGALVEAEYRQKGIGDLLHKLRLEACRRVNRVHLCLCTVNILNTPEIRLLEKNGWRLASTEQGTGVLAPNSSYLYYMDDV